MFIKLFLFFSFDYLSRQGKTETMTISVELKDTITNSSISETSASIRSYAPQTYYTQNRMVTGEDYNVYPLTSNQEIIKNVDQAKPSEKLSVKLSDGELSVEVSK